MDYNNYNSNQEEITVYDVDYREIDPQPPKKPKPSKGRFRRFLAYMVILTFVSGFTFGAGYMTATNLVGDPTTGVTTTSSQQGSFTAKDDGINITQFQSVVTTESSTTTIATIAQEVSPAIVTIASYADQAQTGLFSNFDNYYSGTGSGIVFQATEEELLIVTNYHVIQGANRLEVIFSDTSTIEAETLGYNSRMDVAVLAIPIEEATEHLEDIVIATFGNSEEVVVGELAVAIGNPLGPEYALTVTAGIISALDRDISIDQNTTQVNLIQTDAAINPGNSGGALINASGEVIGINSAKYVDESVEGIGFAIPINDAMETIEDILASRAGTDLAYELSDDRAFLGVGIMDINAEINADTGMTFGVYITEVYPGSGAADAGIQVGDIIYSIDGDRIQNVAELFTVLDSAMVGDTLFIEIVRDNDLLDTQATLSSYKEVMELQE